MQRLHLGRLFVEHMHHQQSRRAVEAHLRMRQRQRQLSTLDAIVELKLEADHLPIGIEQQRAFTLSLASGAAGLKLGEIPVECPGIRVERNVDHMLLAASLARPTTGRMKPSKRPY